MKKTLTITQVIEIDLCQECRFCNNADVSNLFPNSKLIACKRGDCDNWTKSTLKKSIEGELSKVEPIIFDIRKINHKNEQ